ncbi:Invasion protein B [Neorhizobium galegae bv. officinalis]|nr:Invasion protein B [Neorhizobium galegae bv. officinalis]CDZ42740.1 Invasion protein B [Neorhizobium galegae bv. officinalis]
MPQPATAVTSRRPLIVCMALAIAAIASTASAQTQGRVSNGQSLPGGASSLQETYQDWQVTCRIMENARFCAVLQQQVQQNGQRVIAIELQQSTDGKLAGSLVLPFGLMFDNGVTITIDDKPAGEPIRFKTCLPGGCLVPLVIDAVMLASLRTGTSLKIQAVSADGPTVPFTVPLKGFSAASDRLKALTAS